MEKMTITVNELAKTMSIGYTNAYRLANSDGFYPAFRIGRKILINVDKLNQWLDEQTRQEDKAG